jgi:hypothetical protein
MTMILPHDHVYARIARSQIHGVGVEAIRQIPAGTKIFEGDNLPIVWVREGQLGSLPEPLRRLYEDFAVKDGDRLGCPQTFNLLTPAWYLNHSKSPNVAIDVDYDFYSLRDIESGEELTVDYDTFSD